jgi:hypothetical protein
MNPTLLTYDKWTKTFKTLEKKRVFEHIFQIPEIIFKNLKNLKIKIFISKNYSPKNDVF